MGIQKGNDAKLQPIVQSRRMAVEANAILRGLEGDKDKFKAMLDNTTLLMREHENVR